MAAGDAGSDEKDHDIASTTAPDQARSVLAKQASAADSVWLADNMPLGREALLLFVICMAQFCTQTQFTGTLVLLHIIGQTFHITNQLQLAWLVAGYSLTVGTFILFSGRLGDVFGYKRILLIGYAWFAVWSAIAGLTVYSDFKFAVAARVMQGIGPALCLPNALAILGTTYRPGPRKAMVFAFFGAVAPIGGVCGGLFAALFAMAWWPWALWAMAIWLVVLAGISWFAIPDVPQHQHQNPIHGTDLTSWSRTLDLPGATVGMLSLILFNFAWTQAPIDGWDTPSVLVPLILGLVLFGVFGYIEFRVSPNPLLPFDAVNTDVAMVLAAMACGWATFGIWLLYLVQFLEDTRGMSPLLVSGWLSPVVVSGGCAAVFTGKLLGAWNFQPSVVMTLALLAFTTGITLTATLSTDQIYWGQAFVSMLVMPFGMDMSFPAATLILSNAVPKEHQGVAASLVNTVVNYGIALGVGFAGTVELHVRGNPATLDGRLLGYRGAMYMGIGLSALGLGVCAVFLARAFIFHRKS
ncbi:Putative MFS transporter [[Torrubiella] hemipterigena]|uniref:Putative MFS transporter n=1 Tax=[Torrubiella] hemipterigena TaxID=1531966 RepID=A0A0A1TBN9_9HYPO|nr:Putative MFS transporter [[Torrubiella] hemipterigena]